MSKFLDRMKETAKSDVKTIVLPEGEDQRTIDAAQKIVAEGIAKVIILGDPEQINVPGATVVDPATDERHEAYAQKFAELRARKGVTIEEARKQMNDATYFATMMVKMGDADGLVSGACHSTANTLRPALQILRTAPGAKLVSGFFIMDVPNCEFGYNGTFAFADCGLNQDPDSESLAAIANDTANTFRSLVGAEPKVAFLSHSTKGSAKHALVDKVVNAVEIAHQQYPDLVCDGELQLDAAIVPSVAASKAPGSPVAGQANVLIFPNLDGGNIGYKLVQRLAKAEAYGPMLQGIAKPVNDLSRGCSWEDIVGVVALTAVQAQNSK